MDAEIPMWQEPGIGADRSSQPPSPAIIWPRRPDESGLAVTESSASQKGTRRESMVATTGGWVLIVDRWPSLPDHIKLGILAIVRSMPE
jgi:hypothetical protein